MKKKQIYEIAEKIAELESILSSADSTKEEKEKAEKQIMTYATMIMRLPDGFNIMFKIDEIIQKKYLTK